MSVLKAIINVGVCRIRQKPDSDSVLDRTNKSCQKSDAIKIDTKK